MANSLFQQMQPQRPQHPMAQFMQEFNRFRQTYHGNPQREVQYLLSSGQLSQQQFNQLAAEAQQIAQMFGMK